MKYDRSMGSTPWALAGQVSQPVFPPEARGLDLPMPILPYVDAQSGRFRPSRPRLHVYLDASLVPDRNLVDVKVVLQGGSVVVSITHRSEAFEYARPNYYAWQSEARYPVPMARQTYRTLQVPLEQLQGTRQAIERLSELLGAPGSRVYVRRDPVGVTVRVQSRGVSFSSFRGVTRSAREMLLNAERHKTRTAQESFMYGDLSGIRFGHVNIEPLTHSTSVQKGQSMTTQTRLISCTFASSSKQYAYYSDDQSIRVGDFVVVASPYNDNAPNSAELGGYLTVVRVASIDETVEAVNKAAKYIISKVDTTGAVERADRAKRLAVLDAKIAKAEREARAMLARQSLRGLSPELDALVAEREAIS